MVKLKCYVNRCINNEDEICCRPEILVSGRQATESDDTSCSSFAERKNASINQTIFNSPNPLIRISCEAEQCIYNDELECAADFILMEGDYAKRACDTQCHTFDRRTDAY